MSDDGRHALTLIVFVGSVFSPHYARARRHRASVDPENHCAINVALYGAHGKRWSLTERGRRALARSARRLEIGPSSVGWCDEALVFRLDEITTPWPSRIRGEVRVVPAPAASRPIPLDVEQRHHWWPIAPVARVEVDLERPSIRWSGRGYLDSNRGEAPLADAFTSWNWGRGPRADGSTVIFYDVERRDGSALGLGLAAAAGEAPREIAAPPVFELPPTRWWRMPRAARSDAGTQARVVDTLEDTPFYSRSLVASRIEGEPVVSVHESVSLDRFRAPWVQLLLPFRSPRRG